jgi:hypothetical protein
LRSEQGRWKDLLADLGAAYTERKALDEAALGRIDETIGRAGREANTIWMALSRIETEFAANRTGRTAEIYAAYNPRRDVISDDFFLPAIGGVLSASVMVFIGSWLLCALLLLARKPAPSGPLPARNRMNS